MHASAAYFSKAFGASPAAARGATSLKFAASRITKWRIHVVVDASDAIPDGLAHEIAHAVIVERFVHAHSPRWTDDRAANYLRARSFPFTSPYGDPSSTCPLPPLTSPPPP